MSNRFDGRAQYFGYIAQSRILMQLEQVIGVAEKSKLTQTLLKESLQPYKLQ